MPKTQKQRMLDALAEYTNDMDEVVSVRVVHMGLLVTMADGTELHVQVSVLREAT